MKLHSLLCSVLLLLVPATVGAQSAFFYEKASYDCGDWPASILSADLDNDGDQDIAVGNYNEASVTVWLGNGDGTFHSGADYPVAGKYGSIAAADFDGDGFIDLVSANGYPFSYSILLNNGDGSYQDAVNYETYRGSITVYAADLNADDKIDLAIGNTYGDVQILLNNGDATFANASDVGVGNYAFDICIDDFDNDSDRDLVAANHFDDPIQGRIIRFLNDGSGTFVYALSEYKGEIGPRALSAADFDGDGNLDLAVANDLSDNLSIMSGNGDGSFGEVTVYPAGINPVDITTGDLDGDSDYDLMVANAMLYDQRGITVLFNNGDGTFGPGKRYLTEGSPQSVCRADFNGDGTPDMAVANKYANTVSLLFNFPYLFGDAGNDGQINVGDAVYLIRHIFNDGPPPASLEAGDANCDDEINVGDAQYLINYIFRDGPPPYCP